MAGTKERNLTARFTQRQLDELQIVAIVLNMTISNVVRTAVDAHIAQLRADPSFRERAIAARKELDEIYDALLGKSQ